MDGVDKRHRDIPQSGISEGPYRRLNPSILTALNSGQVGVDYRNTGKSITLLTFLAVTQPRVPGMPARAHLDTPIIVTENLRHSRYLRDAWMSCFESHPQPRFMSLGQDPIGLSGIVFVDECELSERWNHALVPRRLVFGGGVRSVGFRPL